MICKVCNKEIEDDSKFCKNCGSVISLEKVSVPEPSIRSKVIIQEIEQIKSNVHCPLYKHTDNIMKVSAVYSSHTSEGRFSGSAINYSSSEYSSISMGGYNITDLGKKLAPPPPPIHPSSALMVVFIILAVFTGITLIGPVIFGLLAYWQGEKNSNLTKQAKEYLPIYEKALMKWNKLYYCFRDDIVFDPDINEYATADNMNSIVFKDLYNQKEISA